MSRATYDWADEQYQAAGLDPAEAKFVGVKNMMNFRLGYADTMKGFFVLDLPGPTPSDLAALPFERLRRPLYPLDPLLGDPGVRVTVSA
jgi:microcystin degradation protein MlrC